MLSAFHSLSNREDQLEVAQLLHGDYHYSEKKNTMQWDFTIEKIQFPCVSNSHLDEISKFSLITPSSAGGAPRPLLTKSPDPAPESINNFETSLTKAYFLGSLEN